jgi:hypothetical protein
MPGVSAAFLHCYIPVRAAPVLLFILRSNVRVDQVEPVSEEMAHDAGLLAHGRADPGAE